MTLDHLDLLDAIDALDADRAGKLVLAASEAERRACWSHVEKVDPHSRRRGDDRPGLCGATAFKVAVAGTAPSATAFASRVWFGLDDPDTHVRTADVLLARRPAWLSKLATPLLAQGWGWNWRLLRELVNRGILAIPDDREEYLCQLVSAASRRACTLRELLDADPGLVEREVYELFEYDECGAWLAANETAVQQEREGQRARRAGTPPPDPHEEAWSQVLADLADEGRLDRARLLDLALRALARDATWSRKRWNTTFLGVLSPTVDEVAARARMYLALLTVGDGPSIGTGQAAVEALLAADRLRPDEVLPVADGPLLRKEKAVALRQLRMLDGIAADPAWVPDAVLAMATAFGHVRPDVQERALTLVGRRVATLPAAVVDELRLAADACAPSLAAEVERALGAVAVPAEAAEAVAPPAGPATPAWEPPPPPTLPPPLTDDAAFVDAAVSVMARNRDALLMERVLEGLLARADRDPHRLATDLAPAVAAARKAVRSHDLVAEIGAAVLLLVGERVKDVTTITPKARNPLVRRLEEMLARVLARQGGPSLSMPTSADGRIDPAVLAERRARLGSIEPEFVRADAAIADLRAGRSLRMVAEAPLPDWHAPETYVTRRGFDWSVHGVKGPLATVWPTVWPHAPGYAVSLVVQYLHQEVEHEPTSWEPSVLVPLLAWLTQPTVETGSWTATALAFGLGSRVALHRAAAVDALLALDHGGRLTADRVVPCVLAAGDSGTIKVNRVAACLTELLPAAPRVTRDLALGLLTPLIEQGHREAHRFATVAADAVATAGAVPLPKAVVETAGRAGTSKLVTEARRLVALTG